MSAIEQGLGGVPLTEDLLLRVQRARGPGRGVEQVEEVLPALLGLLHDRRDVRVVVAQRTVGAGLEAAPEPDNDQDQERDSDADADQASDQILLAAPLRPSDPASWAFRLFGNDHVVLSLVEECQTAPQYEHGTRRMY